MLLVQDTLRKILLFRLLEIVVKVVLIVLLLTRGAAVAFTQNGCTDASTVIAAFILQILHFHLPPLAL